MHGAMPLADRGASRRRGLLAASIAAAAILLVGVRFGLALLTTFVAGPVAEAAAARGTVYADDTAGAPLPPPPSPAPHGRRFSVGAAVAASMSLYSRSEAASAAAEPKITAKCALDVRIGYDKVFPPRQVVIGLFGEEAPQLTQNFLAACRGSLPGEAGQQARYENSAARAVSKGRLIAFADFQGGNYLFKRTAPAKGGMLKEEKIPLAGPDTRTSESNSLRHDVVGRVSMAKGGGSYNFVISPVQSAPWLDDNNVVIGQVLGGLDVIADINNVKTTPKGGIANFNMGVRAVDGPETADDYLMLPLQKIRILKSRLLEEAQNR